MKALVLFSGGLDSSTCLALAVKKYGAKNVVALSIYYGQKHNKEIQAAEKLVKYYGVTWKTLDLAPIFADSDCSLLTQSDKEIPRETYAEQLEETDGKPVSTYVPSETDFSLRQPQALHSPMTAELSTTALTAMMRQGMHIPTALLNSTMP